ncbi:hypothetical protein K4K49_004303 [Colletotrichum sp. SAR 10_70]|nr:hypothetical protein K4K50_008992 [Colletotrichum sp. SAR 10_71]KAI8159276.1 hypothetical protein KHU50_008871 [Colletotrichum sp. SAR 10_65]KAI8171338.1 hypothetical protein K4K49_004303 [Colletotrichum sp. SAR 10_70]
MKYILVLSLVSGALASLNCTSTANVKTYCCPDTNSEVVKTGPAGALIMMGCAADNTNKNWYWNYNGLYTAYSTQFKDCYLNTIPFNDLKGKLLFSSVLSSREDILDSAVEKLTWAA